MRRRVYGLALASLIVIGGVFGLSGCDKCKAPSCPGTVVQPLHATGQTNTQPPIIIDATLRPDPSSGGQTPINGTYTATPLGGNSFSGSIVGTVAGTFDNNGNGGTFTGTVRASLPSGCTASRPYQGPLTRTTLAWVGQPPTETCSGSSPLTFDVTLGVTVEPSDPPTPSVAVAITSAVVTSGPQSGTTQVTANTSWTAASNQSWLTIVSGASGGSGTTTLTYAVQANAGPERRGTITIAHGSTTATLTVNQAAGTPPPDPTLAIVALTPNPALLNALAQSGTATVTASNVTSWTSSSDAAWLTIPSGGSGGSGSSTLTYSAQANASASSRQGTITISATGIAATLTVIQQGPVVEPTVAIVALAPNPASLPALAQTGTATVTATNVGAWTAAASSTGSWLSITSGASGGNGTTTLNYSAQANSGALRTGTITVSASGVPSSTLTVTQVGTTPTLSIAALAPNPPSLSALAQTGTATVAATNVGAWTAAASSTGSWLSITSGASGGNGTTTLNYSAQANSGALRTGTITVSASGVPSAALTVTQATGVFTNGTPINIVGNSLSGSIPIPASPYPSTISVSGLSGSITTVAVTLHGLSHPNLAQVHMVLVGPGEQAFGFMGRIHHSSSGYAGPSGVSNISPTFTDSAAAGWFVTAPLTTASYKPTNIGLPPPLTFPAPGPSSYSVPAVMGSATFGSVFGGRNPNGTWQLYVMNRCQADICLSLSSGMVQNGWSISFTTSSEPSPSSHYPASTLSRLANEVEGTGFLFDGKMTHTGPTLDWARFVTFAVDDERRLSFGRVRVRWR